MNKTLIKRSVVTLITMATMAFSLLAADKNWKDRAEYDLYTAITKDIASPAAAAARLENLDKWKSMYPMSDYADARLQIYLVTYQQLNKQREAFDTANEILKVNPNDITALSEIVGAGIRTLTPTAPNAQLSPQNRSDLDIAEKESRYILSNLDSIYAADKKPMNVTDQQWEQAKTGMRNYAQANLGWIGFVEKDNDKAEKELSAALKMDPTNATASLQLAGVLLGQQKDHPDKMPLALFEYARVAGYDGPNALPPATRTQFDTFLSSKAYPAFHGSGEGLDKLKAMAKTSALPPADFTIKSVVDIAKEKAAADAADAAANPMMHLWNDIKTALTGDGGQAYFDMNMKDAGLPGGAGGVMKFVGKLVSTTPETRPKELQLSIAGGDKADVIIKLDEPLPGKMDPGGEISFSGTAKEFSKDPFNVTFEVDRDDVEGWTGKGPVAPRTGAKKAAPTKKKAD